MMRAKFFGLLVTAMAIAVPLSATAQPTPSTPSYARPSAPRAGDTIKGRVLSFDGGYSLQVADERGYTDNVRLHKGTIINPTGLTLAPGMSVTIHGVNGGSAFVADEIDTPYTSFNAMPVYPYYPYPVYPVYPGYPYGYGYEPRLSFGIGFGGGFHGHEHFR
jgi:hypothetical protein